MSPYLNSQLFLVHFLFLSRLVRDLRNAEKGRKKFAFTYLKSK